VVPCLSSAADGKCLPLQTFWCTADLIQEGIQEGQWQVFSRRFTPNNLRELLDSSLLCKGLGVQRDEFDSVNWEMALRFATLSLVAYTPSPRGAVLVHPTPQPQK
jgi:hypothetical protein